MTTESKTAKTPSPNGRYQLSIRMPREFRALCERDGTTMYQVLQSFVADLCRLVPLSKQNKFTSRGPAAQAAARAYYEAGGFAQAARAKQAKAASKA